MMDKETEFFVYLIERYGAARGQTGGQVLERLDAAGLTDFVFSMYDLYHAERLQNAFDDLDELFEHGLPPDLRAD
ncbi:MAG: DUF3791 domain-containing protein [Bifidobacteriaceae bacterium]|jgi:hypothetical protein|nr:DUF3791 domain-containing protein [Bifidobacteriaceae bacterium]